MLLSVSRAYNAQHYGESRTVLTQQCDAIHPLVKHSGVTVAMKQNDAGNAEPLSVSRAILSTRKFYRNSITALNDSVTPATLSFKYLDFTVTVKEMMHIMKYFLTSTLNIRKL